ncbi:MAG TPA: hypothetical protein VFS43_39435 [Polyangiaceae bacterium]|nr:hypothetical protein [Polyangiaceae bacterium]
MTRRTNTEAILHLQPKRSTDQPTTQPTPQPKAPNQLSKATPKPATKARDRPKAGRAPKKGAGATRRAPKGGDGDEGGEGEPAGPGEGAATLVLADGGSTERAAAYARVEAEIKAVPLASVRPINVHVPSAVVLVLGTLPRLLALRDQILEDYPKHPPETIGRLRDYALAAAHAYAQALPYDGGQTRLRALVSEAGPLRERLLASAEVLVTFGLLDGGAVAIIRRGTGHLDTAQDLLSLGVLFRRAGPALVAKTPLTPADVERATVLGELLLEALGQYREGTDGAGEPSEARARVGQAFELLRRAYEECRHVVTILRWYEGDADDIVPPLAHSRRRARRPPVAEPAPADPGSEPGL